MAQPQPNNNLFGFNLFAPQPPVVQPLFGGNLFGLQQPVIQQVPPILPMFLGGLPAPQPVVHPLFGAAPVAVDAATREQRDREYEELKNESRLKALKSQGIDIKADLLAKDDEARIPSFFKGPQSKAPTVEERKIAQLREQYGDFFVIMASCNDTYVGKLSPIELASIPPFNFNLKLVPKASISKYIAEPLSLPLASVSVDTKDVKTPVSSVGDTKDVKTPALSLDVSLEIVTSNDSQILVSYVTSLDALAYRSNFLANNNPITNYVESLYIPYKVEEMRVVFYYTMRALRNNYLATAKLIQSPIPNNSHYDDATHNKYFTSSVSRLYLKLKKEFKSLDDDGKLDLYNKIMAAQSRYKLVTPKAQDAAIDHYAYYALRDKMSNEYQYSGKNALLHPGLVEYSKSIMKDLVDREAWDAKYFKYVLPLLKIESFRVANTPEVNGKAVNIPKDYCTVFTITQLKELNVLYWRNKREDAKESLNKFVPKILDKLDYSKTCLTGSAICYALSTLEQKRSNIIYEYNAVMTDRKMSLVGKTLDITRGLVLDESKTPVALFKFGADIDLSILTTDSKEFDAIAIKHFGVFSAHYPQLSLVKNVRSTGYTYEIYSTEGKAYNDGFRNVEMYMGTVAKILSHHVPMVRGWYDGELHLDITAVEVYTQPHMSTKFYDNYFYFASSKSSPAEIMYKYYKRGFRYQMKYNVTGGGFNNNLFGKIIPILQAKEEASLNTRRQLYQLENENENEDN